MTDFPFKEVAAEAEKHVQNGFQVFQKFTCAKCGARQTMAVPNTFYTTGSCEECEHVTDIEKQGCNYLLLMIPGKEAK